MKTYDFRLRFNLAPSFRINSENDCLVLYKLETGQEIVLKSGLAKTAIKDCERVVISAQGFSSEDEAHRAAQATKRALLFWAVRFRHGLDLGDRPPTSIVTNSGLEMLEKEHGCPFRNDRHGIDVYEHLDKLKFAHSDATVIAQKSPENLFSTFSEELTTPRPFTAKQALASEIYCSSWFDVGYKSRFLTLVTAIEALVDQEEHSGSVKAFVTETIKQMDASTIDASVKTSLRGSLGRMRRESISQAGRRLASTLLSGQMFDGQSADRAFSKLYGLRSELVHDGAPGKDEELRLAANVAEEFTAKLLLASMGGAPQV
jgi:hypothetical protein